VIGRDHLERSVTKTFRFALCNSDSQLIFCSRRVDTEDGSLFFLSLDSWEAAGYVLLVTGVFCGQLFRDLFSVSFVRGRLPSNRHGGYVTGWKSGNCLLRLFSFCVT